MYDENQLRTRLSRLQATHRIAFAASCCERLLPNYQAFAEVEHWGNPDLLRQALDEVWSFLKGEPLTEQHARALVQAIEPVVPDMDDYSSLYASLAIEAASAVVCTLEALPDGDVQQIVWVARSTVNSLLEYLDTVNDPNTGVRSEDPQFTQWLWQAPLMVGELKKQQDDLDALSSRRALDASFLDELRQSSSEAGIQPFARTLVR